MFHLVGESSWHNSAWSGAILHRTPNEFEEDIFWFSQRSSNRNAREIWSKSAFSERAAIHLICIYLQVVTSKPSYFSQKPSMILLGRSCLKCAHFTFYHTFCVHFTFSLFHLDMYLCCLNLWIIFAQSIFSTLYGRLLGFALGENLRMMTILFIQIPVFAFDIWHCYRL